MNRYQEMLGRLHDGLRRAADFSLRRDVLLAVYLLCLSLMFFTDPNVTSRFVLYYFLLPLAALALFSSNCRVFPASSVFLACAIYLAAMALASFVQPGAAYHLIWRELRLSAIIVVFLWVTALLITTDRKVDVKLVAVVGSALAASAALNIYFYVSAAPSPSAVFHFSSRLIATIGMPSYTNATNISATYAVFFAGLMAALVQGGLPLLARAPIACAAAVLFVGVVLTDSRSAYVAIASTLLIVSATSSRRVKILVGSALMGLLAFALWRPDFREALLSRGSGRRFIVWNAFWSLIEKKPIFGYGSLDTTTGFTDKGMFLDQAHNLVLSAWFRGGVVSALAMLCILLGGIYWANRYRVATGSLVPLCMIVAIAAAGMFDYQLLTTYPTWPWATFWLPFGLCIGAEMATRSRTA